MSDVVLRTVGLGKMYHIGGERQAYRTLRDTIAQAAKRPLERIRHPGAATHTSEDLWALRNIDLEIRPGEMVGVIGRNGSGKSTLLKVLSRITEPTEGRAEIKGRVASLLEVGTGFHNELTGRENIQLNGAILGMKRAEIKSKFDDIVEFSGIGKFLDTPVKRYSSGMYVRLAFSVAAHLEPDILIVDEVLSVGDAEFRKKSLGKMDSVAREGRTVLFVSHNMPSIRELCNTAVLLDHGSVTNRGDVSQVINDYLSTKESLHNIPIRDRRDRGGSGRLTFCEISVDDTNSERGEFSVELSIHNHTSETLNDVLVSVVIEDNSGRPLANIVSYNVRYSQTVGPTGARLRIHITDIDLVPGTYSLSPFLSSDAMNSEIFDWVTQAAVIKVPAYDYYDIGRFPIADTSTVFYPAFKFEALEPPE
jgi:lipopolysaccharide transport system ATP-binding protein